MKIHYTTQELTADMTVGQRLMRRTACGAKATFSAQLMMTTQKAGVDCARCAAKMDQPAKETYVQREARKAAEKAAKAAARAAAKAAK